MDYLLNMRGLSEIHNCKECKGKMVDITVDKLGVTRCGYCGEVVDYKQLYKGKKNK